jgi:UDP-N-acetylglucosamine 2-epimerase (non-hydrolysing)
MKVAIAFGTRPEIIKIAPIVEEAAARPDIDLVLINTSQHFDWEMSGSFLELFRFPAVDHTISELPGKGVERFGQMLIELGRILEKEAPDVLLVQGDTTTALVGALAGAKTKVPVGHVEAGLRSFNEQSPEEVNRKVIAQLASVHFAPTPLAAHMLRREGIGDDRIEVVGNPVVDALRRMEETVRALPSVLEGTDTGGRTPVLVTVHRPGNTDRPERLSAILEAFLALERAFFLFPIHPRTRAALEELPFSADSGDSTLLERVERAPNIRLLAPLSYTEFTKLMSEVDLVVTDSGGVQEEANTLGKAVLTLRPSTPRWEGILAGANRLCPTEKGAIVQAVDSLLENLADRTWSTDLFGDGEAAPRILDALRRLHEERRLQPREPSYFERLPDAIAEFSAG